MNREISVSGLRYPEHRREPDIASQEKYLGSELYFFCVSRTTYSS